MALGISVLIIGFLYTYFFHLISNKIMIDIRNDIFNHIIYLKLSFFNDQKVGDLVQKINNEVDIIRRFITQTMIRIVKNSILVIGLVTALLYLNSTLFLLSMVTFPFAALSLKYFQPKIKLIIEI